MRQEVIDARRHIQAAMDATGLDATNLAKVAEVAPSTLTRLMSADPKNTPNHKTMMRVAQAVRRLTGKSLLIGSRENTPDDLSSKFVRIPEYDIQVSAGSGTIITEGDEVVAETWTLPLKAAMALSSNVEHLCILSIKGDSMEPDYQAGERVLIDSSCHSYTHDGVYVLDFGFGLVIKQLQLVLGSCPHDVMVVSKNPDYIAQKMPLSQTQIKGRVVAKWVLR